MQKLMDVIIKAFRDILPMDIIIGKVKFDSLSIELLQKISLAYDYDVSESEKQKLLHSLKDQIDFELHEEWSYKKNEGFNNRGLNVYDLVDIFSRKVLEKVHEEIVCNYEQLQTWRAVSGKIGEELFIAAMYAYIDFKNGKYRTTFSWRYTVGHSNIQLNTILSEGISENHFHLHASVPYFDLSWLTLMNLVDDSRLPFILEKIDNERRNPRRLYSSGMVETRYEVLHMQAALIRLFLFAHLTGRKIKLKEYYAPWKWLLNYIFEKEQVFHHLFKCEEKYKQIHNVRKGFKISCKCFEKKYSCIIGFIKKQLESSGGEDNLANYLQKFCPGFYWLIMDRLPCLLEHSKKLVVYDEITLWNLREFLITVTENLPQIPLEECKWIFKQHSIEPYEKEWWRQTDIAIMESLKSPNDLLDNKAYFQRILNSLQDSKNLNKRDYAMNAAGSWYKEDKVNSFMIGERWILYTMMRLRYERGVSKLCYKLFYAYLVIKEAFRMELLQSNDRVGFTNFRKYQSRKGWFTVNYTEGDLAKIAVDMVFRNQVIKSLELRIKPGNTCEEDVKIIQRYDRAIEEKDKREHIYYVFDFSKRPDDTIPKNQDVNYMQYRHYKLRHELRKQAEAIVEFRRKNPKIAQRLRGIDACSDEDGCRPEVFATVYRVLKNHSCYRGLSLRANIPQLRATYHVGEVFQDILDGLRAIDEAIHFLNLGYGDRIGHAIVLGLDTVKWYREKNYMIAIRQQDYLDNVVWLYHRLIRYKVPDSEQLQEYLKREFQLYFSLIYEKVLDTKYIELAMKVACKYDREYGMANREGRSSYDFNINTYYYAWMLRGDNPSLYEEGYYKQPCNSISIWDDYSVNTAFPKNHRIRYIPAAVILNHYYHFHAEIKRLGNKFVNVKIPANIVSAIDFVQKELQKEIASREICIETNPSSNLMISTLKSYADHPILNFYNKGLTNDPNQLRKCPQINVSINTDDQGVFATCLSNEYALMVSALGQEIDENGNYIYQKSMIYEWMKNVQEMGNQQSFLHELEARHE